MVDPLASHGIPSLRQCYFITTAIRGRRGLLGRLHEGGVTLSRLGIEVTAAWERIGAHRRWISTGAFVVMPDHVHGLLWWDRAPNNRVSTISVVMSGFKADATRSARKARLLGRHAMLWQDGFFARQILTDRAFERAARYIHDNPVVVWSKLPGLDPEPVSPPADPSATLRAGAGGSAGHG